MATIKSYTDLEQSRKLAEILPLESANMCYKCIEDDPYDIICKPYSEWKKEYKGLLIRNDAKVIPAWSLAALLNVLPKVQGFKPTISLHYNYITYPHMSDLYTKADNLVDACYEMIICLNELNLL